MLTFVFFLFQTSSPNFVSSFFKKRKIWDILVLIGLVLYVFFLPISFMHLIENSPFTKTPVLLSIEYVLDAFFIADAVFNFHFFFYFEEGLLVRDKSYIHQKFISSHSCWREIIGLLPLDLLSCFFGGRYLHHFRLVKVVRIPNIVNSFQNIDSMLSELNIDIDLSLYRVIKLNIVMITACHWVGCIWFMMASLSIAFGYDENWRDEDENNELLSVKHSDFAGFAGYLRSVYWALVGMSTVGEFSSTGEYINSVSTSSLTSLFHQSQMFDNLNRLRRHNSYKYH